MDHRQSAGLKLHGELSGLLGYLLLCMLRLWSSTMRDHVALFLPHIVGGAPSSTSTSSVTMHAPNMHPDLRT